MDSLATKYRAIVEQVLQEYADFLGQDDPVQQELIFDVYVAPFAKCDRVTNYRTAWKFFESLEVT